MLTSENVNGLKQILQKESNPNWTHNTNKLSRIKFVGRILNPVRAEFFRIGAFKKRLNANIGEHLK